VDRHISRGPQGDVQLYSRGNGRREAILPTCGSGWKTRIRSNERSRVPQCLEGRPEGTRRRTASHWTAGQRRDLKLKPKGISVSYDKRTRDVPGPLESFSNLEQTKRFQRTAAAA